MKTLTEIYPDVARWFRPQSLFQGGPEVAHVATVEQGGSMTWVRWAKPGSSTYRVDMVFHLNRLFVAGDIGEAVYAWSQIITPEFVASCDLSYFASKQAAARDRVRNGQSWSRNAVEKWLGRFIEEYSKSEENWIRHLPKDYDEDEISAEIKAAAVLLAKMEIEDQLEEIEGLDDAKENSHCWAEMAYSNMEIFGDDPDCDVGLSWDVHTIGHLMAVQLAVEWLEKQKVTESAAAESLNRQAKLDMEIRITDGELY